MKNGYILRIELDGIDPAILRRIAVPAAITLADLHEIVQIATCLENYHLHEFRIAGSRYGVPDAEFDDTVQDEAEVKLAAILNRKGQKTVYLYEFGDDWEHTIKLEDYPDEPLTMPAVVDGARACPPEDCGRPWSYDNLLAALADPNHEGQQAMIEWVGGNFAPERFSIQLANKALISPEDLSLN